MRPGRQGHGVEIREHYFTLRLSGIRPHQNKPPQYGKFPQERQRFFYESLLRLQESYPKIGE
jgi:hypothetical protein